MGHRLSKIYTRTGDEGTTGLYGGGRVLKNDLRIAAYGTRSDGFAAELINAISRQLDKGA